MSIKLALVLLFSGSSVYAWPGLSVTPQYVSGGKQVYEAICNGTARSMGDCYKLANKECNGQEIEILDKTESTGAMGNYKQVLPVIKRSLLFKCK